MAMTSTVRFFPAATCSKAVRQPWARRPLPRPWRRWNGYKATVNLHYVSGDANALGYPGMDTDVVSLGVILQYY